jgi:hypothetical protein
LVTRTTRTTTCEYHPNRTGKPFAFSFTGRSYTADLCPTCRNHWTATFRELADAGRVRPGGRRTKASRERTAEIRAWARQTGRAVSDRGRLPAGIVRDYETETAA